MTVIQHRRGTTAEWAASSYILEAGEIGVELDTTTTPDTVLGIKVGNGESLWGVLDYVGGTAEGLLPVGGLEGQILSKTTDTDYDAQWIDNFAPDTRILVKNDSGVSLAKGTPVMAVGATGDRIRVAKAVADGSVEPRYMLGVMFETVANGSEGYLTLTGEITNLDTSAYTIGDILYIDPNTPGIFTTTAPSSPDLSMAVAIVTRVNASSGRIFVRMWDQQSGLHEQHDVLIDTPADNEVLAYDSTSGVWKNQTASEAGLATPSDIATAIANLVDSAPTTLDTLNELAAALGDDANFATTVTDALALKQPLDSDLTAIAALTSTGILKRTGTNTWSLITDNSSNWDTAYGWGNHASAGYLTTSAASSTYLTQTNAASTYLTQSSASSTYLTQSNAASTYLALTGGTLTGDLVLANKAVDIQDASARVGRLIGSGGILYLQGGASSSDTAARIILGRTASSSNVSQINLRGDTITAEGATTVSGVLTVNGGITGAAAKNMTVASSYSGTTFGTPRVIMTASSTGAAAPTTRPDTTTLQTGDVWISW
jgi:Major tropism determinant N-terminal domain